MSATPATKALEKANVAFSTHTYAHDPKHESYGTIAMVEPETIVRGSWYGVERTPRVTIRRM